MTLLGKAGGTGPSGTDLMGLTDMARAMKLRTDVRDGADVGCLRQRLIEGKCVIANGNPMAWLKSDTRAYGHYVLVRRQKGSQFEVADPHSPERKTATPEMMNRYLKLHHEGGHRDFGARRYDAVRGTMAVDEIRHRRSKNANARPTHREFTLQEIPMRSLIATMLVLSTACATTGASASRADRPARLSEINALHPTNPKNGLIVMYRNTVFSGMFGPIVYSGSVYVDQMPVGDLRDDSYAAIEVAPVRHSLRVQGAVSMVQLQASSIVAVEPGQIAFVQLDSQQSMGGGLTVTLKQVDRASAVNDIAADCKQAFIVNVGDEPIAHPKSADATTL